MGERVVVVAMLLRGQGHAHSPSLPDTVLYAATSRVVSPFSRDYSAASAASFRRLPVEFRG